MSYNMSPICMVIKATQAISNICVISMGCFPNIGGKTKRKARRMLHINKNLDIYIDQTIQIIKEQPNVLD